jgi:hypothetical protein
MSHASLLQDTVVIRLRFIDRLGQRFDCRIEGNDGGVQPFRQLAEVSRKALRSASCYLLSLNTTGLSYHVHPCPGKAARRPIVPPR